jgi:uncharacterized protein
VQVACQRRSAPALEPPIAPLWHTRALVALLLVAPFAGLLLAPVSSPPAGPRGLAAYLPSVLVSVGLAGFVSRWGLPKSILAQLLGETWRSWGKALGDVTLAAVASVVVLAADAALVRALGAPESVAAHAFLPQTLEDRLLWSLVALAAGVGEELVYRGYLQRQLTVSCRSRAAGVVLQSLLFGVAHGEQGGAVVARFALYGAALGVLALVRRSLLPGILAHVALDVYAGLSS